jgi:arabinan endo-1,5-alpha-L-arabinosidase
VTIHDLLQKLPNDYNNYEYINLKTITMRKLFFTIAFLTILLKAGAQSCDTTLFPNGVEYYDTYHDVASDLTKWKHYNTHDPTVNKQGEWYYMYSTDASWGGYNSNGALKRRSKDLVNWEFLGNAFDGTPDSAQNFFKTVISGVANSGKNPSYTDDGVWAPYLLKYKGKYILYYSAPGGLSVNYAFIGYATSDSAKGPWVDQGMITSSYLNTDTINAIDPSVIYDSTTHKLWMSYGSWFNGIYILELDTLTGGIKTKGDRGVKICNRKTSSYGQEGSELNYRNGWYYLFVSYDALGDLYNVRVGRSRTPNGPYYDFNGTSMAGKTNNIPMIQSPYRFNHHKGWQGTGHCGVYNDSGKYYMFNQGRPSKVPSMMVLHVREMFWIDDWPVLSPERYAGVPQCSTITADSLIGKWEHMPLKYHTSTSTDFHSTSDSVHLYSNGTFNNNSSDTWTFENDTLHLTWSNGDIQKLVVFWGWDWENECRTILYSGLSTKGIAIWGKKINQVEVDRYNKIVDGATYSIRNMYSHLLMQVPNSSKSTGTAITQGADAGLLSQLWKVKSAGNGYYYMLPQHSDSKLIMEVRRGSSANNMQFITDTLNGTDKQKFRLSTDSGSFHILTKVSDTAKCADMSGYSISEGGNVIQYTYSANLNQQWRFKKIDSIAIDTVSIDTFSVNTGVVTNKLLAIHVYPNPSTDGKFTVDVSSLDSKNINLSIFDLKGIEVYNKLLGEPSVYTIDTRLTKGVYVIQIGTASKLYLRKLIIQ